MPGFAPLNPYGIAAVNQIRALLTHAIASRLQAQSCVMIGLKVGD